MEQSACICIFMWNCIKIYVWYLSAGFWVLKVLWTFLTVKLPHV